MMVRKRAIQIALLGVVVLAMLAFMQRRPSTAGLPIERVAAADDRPSPIATAERVPISGSDTQSPQQVSTERRGAESQTQTRARSAESGNWAVIAATYNAYSAASKRAQSLRSQFAACSCSVFPREGEGQKYYVVVGSGLTQDAAEAFRQQGVNAGLPSDTYVTKLAPKETESR